MLNTDLLEPETYLQNDSITNIKLEFVVPFLHVMGAQGVALS